MSNIVNSRFEQRGAATILVALILLIASTLLVLIAGQASVTEQRLSANDVRARQALAAAQAGVDHALAYRRTPKADLTLEVLSNGTLDNASYRARFCLPDATPPACPVNPADAISCGIGKNATANVGELLIYSCGWSDDGAARRPITQLSSRIDSFGAGIAMPLVARGTANLLVGGATILNYFNDLTVWSGDNLLGQSMTGKTFIRSSDHAEPQAGTAYRNTGNSPTCNNPPTGYMCSTQGSDIGHDVIISDPNLAGLGADPFFQTFMGTSLNDYNQEIASIQVDADSSADIAALNGIKAETIWINGNTSLDGVYGTENEPVVIVVDGDLNLGANAVINGIVFVTENLNGNGTPRIYGAMIVAGTANATGNLTLVFDPSVIGKATKLGAAVGKPGSWKDWLSN